MVIHYQNAQGEEKFIKNIIHLHNINDNEWEALTDNNKMLRLFTSRIEAVIDEKLLEGANVG